MNFVQELTTTTEAEHSMAEKARRCRSCGEYLHGVPDEELSCTPISTTINSNGALRSGTNEKPSFNWGMRLAKPHGWWSYFVQDIEGGASLRRMKWKGYTKRGDVMRHSVDVYGLKMECEVRRWQALRDSCQWQTARKKRRHHTAERPESCTNLTASAFAGLDCWKSPYAKICASNETVKLQRASTYKQYMRISSSYRVFGTLKACG